MRLWHEKLIKVLPRQQLLGQHRECCALRGNGFGKKHSTIQYVFNYSPYKLYQYHMLIISEMEKRGYKPNELWKDCLYRGKSCNAYIHLEKLEKTSPIYIEHDNKYLKECLDNLKNKGINIEFK